MELSPDAGGAVVVRIVLPRSLSWDAIVALRARVTAVERGVLVLEGQGAAFCEGGALDPTAVAVPQPLEFAALLRAIESAPVAVVALVDGPALGAGAGLAAAADVVLATPRARFGLPEAVMGLLPAMVFPVLARRMGVGRARRLALGAVPLSAAEAHVQGLVDEVVEDLPTAGARVCRRLARLDAQAVRALKELVATHFGTTEAYEAAAAQALCARLASPETRERLRRFEQGEAPWSDDER